MGLMTMCFCCNKFLKYKYILWLLGQPLDKCSVTFRKSKILISLISQKTNHLGLVWIVANSCDLLLKHKIYFLYILTICMKLRKYTRHFSQKIGNVIIYLFCHVWRSHFWIYWLCTLSIQVYWASHTSPSHAHASWDFP